MKFVLLSLLLGACASAPEVPEPVDVKALMDAHNAQVQEIMDLERAIRLQCDIARRE